MVLTASSLDHCADGGSVTEILARDGKVHVYEPASSQGGNTESQAMKSWPEPVADQKRRIQTPWTCYNERCSRDNNRLSEKSQTLIFKIPTARHTAVKRLQLGLGVSRSRP